LITIGNSHFLGKKIKIQKRRLLGRLSDGSFVPSFYVYFCRSFLLRRLLGLQVTVSGLAKVAIFTTNVDAKNQCLINYKCVFGALNRQFFVGAVMGWFSILIHSHQLNISFSVLNFNNSPSKSMSEKEMVLNSNGFLDSTYSINVCIWS
jgi:hypothetical protein